MKSTNSRLHGVIGGAALCLAASLTQAQTPFEQDVATSIDRGLDYLEGIGAFGPSPGSCNNFGDNSEARGLALLALLEKRASGNPGDPPQGYSGASAADKGRMRNAVACMLDWSDTMSALSYHNGNYLMGLSLYLRSGGPDKASLITSGEIPAGSAGNYDDLITAINRMVDRLTIAPNPQTANGYWGYTVPNVDDSSTTQFAAAGLASAKAVYSNPSWSDPGRVATINTALARARQAYIDFASTNGSDNFSCDRIEETEAGHGYRRGNNPSLQQTSSGTWVQLLGGATVNDPTVQSYLRWLRNHYRWETLDSMGNSWPTTSYWYYLWSSFKAMEFIDASGVAVAPGNIGPHDIGMLGPNEDPDPSDGLAGTCNVRQVHQDPATLPRAAGFGGGPVGYYAGEPQEQYFDYAYEILDRQCDTGDINDGSYICNNIPSVSRWNNVSSTSYALLVLQRATGGACVDSDGDGICDSDDNCVADPNPDQSDRDSDGVGDVCDNCPDVFNPGQEDSNGDGIGDACSGGGPGGAASCDMDGDGDIDRRDIRAITRARGDLVDPGDLGDPDEDGRITRRDVKMCTKLI